MKEYDEAKLGVMLENYVDRLKQICFSGPDQSRASKFKNQEDILTIVNILIESNLELNQILEICPASIYITGKGGMTERVNKAFEETTGIAREKVVNRNVVDLEKEGIFAPSMYRLVSNEQREISCLQEADGGKRSSVATGVPVYGDEGSLVKVITNAIDINKISKIFSYMNTLSPCASQKNHKIGGKQIIAESQSMKRLIGISMQIADVDSNVLITGESGVGKGVLAKFIHRNSYRRANSFVQINCGAIPENLLESELFGYERGAFTGADKYGKRGLIELADKGTLFLDEIGELPLMLQVKLLNFLQDRKIIRVGGTREIPIDTRVIAATNKELMRLVYEGKFRDDLFYRLNVVPLKIPPLRERKEDIIPAAKYFANHFSEKYHKKFELNETFLEPLINQEWKGNMRELENYIERMIVMAESENILSSLIAEEKEALSMDNSAENQMSLQYRLEKYEAEIVREAYRKYPNTYKVAEVLGISQPSASRKVKKYIREQA